MARVALGPSPPLLAAPLRSNREVGVFVLWMARQIFFSRPHTRPTIYDGGLTSIMYPLRTSAWQIRLQERRSAAGLACACSLYVLHVHVDLLTMHGNQPTMLTNTAHAVFVSNIQLQRLDVIFS
jgi:hypothetical protein